MNAMLSANHVILLMQDGAESHRLDWDTIQQLEGAVLTWEHQVRSVLAADPDVRLEVSPASDLIGSSTPF